MATIFHIAFAEDWAAAQASGVYTTSTRGRSLADVGFIHCSRGDQWPNVRDAVYGDTAEPLVLLQVDTDRLDVPVVEEAGEPFETPRPSAPQGPPGGTETFPHVYGPLPVGAVVKVIPLPVRAPASAASSDDPTASTPAASPGFSSVYFREMLGNALLVCLVIATAFAGYGIGRLFGDEIAPLVGALLGVADGVVLARILYRRRS